MARTESGGKQVLKVVLYLILLAVIFYLGVVVYEVIMEKKANNVAYSADDYDSIVILGAQVKPDGEPSVQLQWRLDAGYEAWQKKQVPVVVCGAKGGNEPATEASVMKDYLMTKGVPEAMVFMDDASFNTNQNLLNASVILKQQGIDRCLIVTSDYHVARAMALAADMGIQAVGTGSPCKAEFWIKNHAREALAWCKYWAVKYLRIPLE